ncbi:hypothetical protein RD792_014923 [Penstemon davidsonii]|uniref:C3H1-type domain-containing protein n=1 Tax=Penstemon davidsonii TaxID=160366 RepID=A0ABR0CRR9_9LAMI|nr:hypothetical protein RD792_014923 [Penstemon davidsonii]
MDDGGEGGLSFDFEGGLDTVPTHPTAFVPVIQPRRTLARDPQVLRMLITFLQSPWRRRRRKAELPADSVSTLAAISVYEKRCLWVSSPVRQGADAGLSIFSTVRRVSRAGLYKLGFCPNGPDCRYRHAKLPGPPPPVEEVLQKIQQLTSYNFGNS